MAKKFDMSKSSDMRKFQKHLANITEETIKEQAKAMKYEIECPHCGEMVSLAIGKSVCPKCGKEIDLNLNL